MNSDGFATALAPAKVNTSLVILAKRDDGFHELQTQMVCLELSDTVRARARADGAISLSVTGPAASTDIPCDESNLVWRAARAWLDLHGESRGVDLELTKNVPSQAGLGGGSSDAAAAILACSETLQLPLHDAHLEAQLAALGSDCVFFGSAGTTGAAWCEGRGERVTPKAAPAPAWHVSIVVPDVQVATSAVYSALELSLGGPRDLPRLNPEVLQLVATAARHWLINDLELPALESFPELRAWRNLLDRTGRAHYCLAGSGATFFGLFDSHAAASESTRVITESAQASGLSMRASFVTRTVSHAAQLMPADSD